MSDEKKKIFLTTYISGIIYSICISSLLGIANLNVYITSYIHLVKENLSIHYGNFIAPLTIFSIEIFTPIGGLLEKKIRSRLIILLGAVIMEISSVCLYYQQDMHIFYLLILSMGFGYGISLSICTKNACFFYPKHKGIILSSFLSFGILAGAGFTLVGEKIINPNKQIITKEYYDKEICEKTKLYFIIMSIAIPIGAIIGIIFFRKYNSSFDKVTKKKSNEDSKESKEITFDDVNKMQIDIPSNEEPILQVEVNSQNNSGINNQSMNESFESITYNKNLKEALKNKRFWIIAMLGSFPTIMIGFTYSIFRTYATLIQIDGDLLYFLPALLYILMSISSIIWALVIDKFAFRFVMLFYCLLSLIESFAMLLFIQNEIVFIACVLLSSTLIISIMGITSQHVMQLYGIQFQLILGGIVQLFNGITYLLGALLSVIFSFYFETGKELRKPYKILACISIPFGVVALIFGLMEKDDRFVYQDDIDIDLQLIGYEKKNKKDKDKDESINNTISNNNNESKIDISFTIGSSFTDSVRDQMVVV